MKKKRLVRKRIEKKNKTRQQRDKIFYRLHKKRKAKEYKKEENRNEK